MTVQTVCLLGGSGFLGRHLAERLCSRGLTVRVPSRHRERAKDALILLPTVEVVSADVHDPARLAALLSGCDAVVNLVGVLHDHPRGAFQRNHVTLPSTLVAACRDAGVGRLVHVSAVGADPNGPSAYLRSKGEGEARIMEAAAHGIATTVVRPSVVFGQGDGFLNLFARLARVFPVLPLGSTSTRFQPIWVEDVAHAIDRLLDAPEAAGQTMELCGPRVYTLRELVEYAAAASGHRRRVISLPPALAWWQALVLEHLPGRPMTRDNLLSMSVDNICGCPFPAVLGFAPTPLEAVAPRVLCQVTPRTRHGTRRQTAGR